MTYQTNQPLNGIDIYNLLTGILGGQQMDKTLFYSLLTIVASKIHRARQWMILKKTDSSESITPAATFQTQFTIPDDFMTWQAERPVILVDPTNTNNFIDWITEVTSVQQWRYQFQSYKYYGDYINKKMYIMGTVDKTYTIYKNYIKQPPVIDDATPWGFPADFHPLLAYGIAALNKGGIDFDETNARMAGDNKETVQSIYEAMLDWDNELQMNSTIGIDRSMPPDSLPYITGHIDMNS